MKARIVHKVLLLLLLPYMYSCSNNDDDRLAEPVPLTLDLNITLTTRADAGEEKIPEWEKVKDLRIVLKDADGKMECDKVFDVASQAPSVSADKYRYTFNVKIETTSGKKTLYALANTESMNISANQAKSLDSYVMKGNAETKTDDDTSIKAATAFLVVDTKSEGADVPSIPATSKKYELNLQPEAASTTVHEEIAMVYATTKFELTFENSLQTAAETKSGENDLIIVKWGISDVASQSYLIPRITEWDKLVELGGSWSKNPKSKEGESNAKAEEAGTSWVTGYTVPSTVTYSRYEYEGGLSLPQGQQVSDSHIYYLHESKYLPDKGSTEQGYSLILWVKQGGQKSGGGPILLTAEFPHLKSLVRGTYVKVVAEIKKMPNPEDFDNSLEVKVEDWESGDTAEGGWEPANPEDIPKDNNENGDNE